MLKLQYFIAAAAAMAAICVPPWSGRERGAAAASQASATDFYHVERLSGRAWLLAPNGSRQLLLGLNHVHLVSASAPRTDLDPAYVDQRSAQILGAMAQLGFNTLGGDADADLWHRGLPYVQSLDLSHHLQADEQTPVVDVYAPGFTERIQALANAACAPRSRDAELIGYFSDDGLAWDPGRPGQAAALLRYYLGLPLSAAGRQRAMDYLRIRYNSNIVPARQAWGVKARDFLELTTPAPTPAAETAFAADASGFARAVFLRYLQAAADAIRAADPNHLFLGANLHPASAAMAWTAADVTSVAVGDATDVAAVVTLMHQQAAHPLLVSVTGCARPPDLAPLWRAPEMVGVMWSPDGDWQSGACAQAAPAWRALNQHAATEVSGAGR